MISNLNASVVMKNLEFFKEKNEDGYNKAVRRLADFFEYGITNQV